MPQGYCRNFRILPRSIGAVTFVAHVLEFLLIAGLVVVAAALAAAFLVGRSYVRRHWRLLHGHVAVRGVLATLALLAAGRERYAGRATPEDLSRARRPGAPAHVGGGRGRRDRRGPRRVARRPGGRAARGVPLAARAWPTSSTGCSAWSAACPPGASRADVRRQVAEVIGAARDVQAAAVRAGSDATEPQVRSLVRHARDEVDIVSTALAAHALGGPAPLTPPTRSPVRHGAPALRLPS